MGHPATSLWERVSTVYFGNPMLPADLFVLSPGYKVLPGLGNRTPAPLVCAVCICSARNVGSNVRTDIAGIVT